MMFSMYNTKLAASSPELHEVANIEVKLVLLYTFLTNDHVFRLDPTTVSLVLNTARERGQYDCNCVFVKVCD